MHHYDEDEVFDKNALDKLARYFDKSFSEFEYHGKNDDFDFTNKDRTRALECTMAISENLRKADIYEKYYERGRKPRNDIPDSIVDKEGVLCAYLGGGMEETRKNVINSIKNKISKILRHKGMTNIKVDLCISVPEMHLFNREEELDVIQEYYLNNKLPYDRIFVLFNSALFVFGNSRKLILFEEAV